MHILSSMRIQADRATVLKTLCENREKHSTIVRESREGFVAKALVAVTEKLEKLKKGKVTSLNFALQPPQDHTDVYDTAIKMLSMHTEATITLDSTQVRNLVMDEWDWKFQFLAANSMYSGTAAAELGGKDDDDVDDVS